MIWRDRLSPRKEPGRTLTVALAGSVIVLSVNRHAPEQGVGLGSPSVATARGGEVVVSTTEPLALVTLDADRVTRALEAYPGYVAVR